MTTQSPSTSASGPRAPDPARLRAATAATYVAFGGSGFAFASWASRIPQVRDGLDLSTSALGLVLLAIAAGSLTSLPLAGTLVARAGSRQAVTVMAGVLAAALLLIATGYLAGVAAVVVGLYVFGFANGAWDVAMNVQGAAVERRLGQSIMSRFHAGFSLGTVAGALAGAAMVALDVPVTAHLAGVALLVGVAVPRAARAFIPDEPDLGQDIQTQEPAPSALSAWREPRTLLAGLFVLAFAFAEGAGNDWISVAVIDDHDLSAAIGTLAFAGFLAAMTLGRWFGPGLLDRHGRVAVLRALAALGIVGSLLFSFGPVALGLVGVLLWGVGASLGFPVGMSAAADDPARAAGRVSVIASIGYCAFLGGPPLVGLLGDAVGVLHALSAVSVLLVLAALIAGSVREPQAGEAPSPA